MDLFFFVIGLIGQHVCHKNNLESYGNKKSGNDINIKGCWTFRMFLFLLLKEI